MAQENYFIKLNSETVQKLPYNGPIARRIYVVFLEQGKEIIKEIFVQRFDAFTTDLIGSINRLKNNEICEIRYNCGIKGFIIIYLDEKGNLSGQFLTKSKQEFDSFKNRLKIAE